MKNASFFYFDILNKVSTSNDKFYSTFKIQPRFHAKGRFSDISVLQKYKKSHRFHIDIRNFWNHLRTSFKSVPFSVGPWNWYTWVALAHGLLVLSRETYVLPRQTLVLLRQTLVSNRQTNVLPRQTVVLPRKTLILPRETLVLPRHAIALLKHTQLLPRKTLLLSRQTVV